MKFRWPPSGWPPKKPHHFHVVLNVAGVGIILEPWETTYIMTNPVVGQTLPLSIAFLDQHGNPMANPPTPDAPPTWTDSTPTVETLTAAADGLSANAVAVSAGADTITLSLAVGGVSFSASLAVTVVAAPQVLTSVAIVAGTPA